MSKPLPPSTSPSWLTIQGACQVRELKKLAETQRRTASEAATAHVAMLEAAASESKGRLEEMQARLQEAKSETALALTALRRAARALT